MFINGLRYSCPRRKNDAYSLQSLSHAMFTDFGSRADHLQFGSHPYVLGFFRFHLRDITEFGLTISALGKRVNFVIIFTIHPGRQFQKNIADNVFAAMLGLQLTGNGGREHPQSRKVVAIFHCPTLDTMQLILDCQRPIFTSFT